jgi:hypothetical protein
MDWNELFALRARNRGGAELATILADAKQNTDQCAGALGQRMVLEYGPPRPRRAWPTSPAARST